MKVLVACEESQEVCKAFRARGHEAYSCDIQACSGGHPEWHIIEDVTRVLSGGYWDTQLGIRIYAEYWDLMIGHPPCTYLSFAGMHWEKKQPGRKEKRLEAMEFFMALWNAPIKKKCLENPQGYPQHAFRKPNQIIHPYYFGDPHLKRTCLWLDGLPKLQGLQEVAIAGRKAVPQPDKWITRKSGDKAGGRRGIYFMDQRGVPTKEKQKHRSKTFPGIAKAMAAAWSEDLTTAPT